MSYRDIRHFTEMMRSLGYPRLISMENFRNPNFPLVAEITLWLVKRYEVNADLPTDIETEQDRVIFIRSVAQFLALKMHIKVNTKRLYQADGYAVKELVKVAELLYNSMKKNKNSMSEIEELDTISNFPTVDLSSKLQNVKMIRQLVSDITNKGAILYDLLGQEAELKVLRNGVISKQFDINEVERSIRAACKKVEEEILKTNRMIENVACDEVNLDAKIEKKKDELGRSQNRLSSLKKLRPAHMDEYEKLEIELAKTYQIYIEKFRCLAYLEQLLDEYEHIEEMKLQERESTIKKMIEKMQMEDNLQVDGDDNNVDVDILNNVINRHDALKSINRLSSRRPQPSRRFGPPNNPSEVIAVSKRVFGSMTGDESVGSITDSDLELDGEDDIASDMATDEEIEIDNMVTRKLNPRTIEKMQADDDDF